MLNAARSPNAEQLIELQIVPIPRNIPQGEPVRVTWLADRLVVQYEEYRLGETIGYAYANRLWQLHPDGSDWQRLPIRQDRRQCAKAGYEEPTALPDGRLSYILRCNKDPNVFVDEIQMMTYSVTIGEDQKLLTYPLPFQHSRQGTHSWNPQLTKGIADDRNGLSEQLYWFMPDRWEPLRLSFSRAITAVWSPDGKRIAFWGAPEQGLYGIGKAEAVFILYTMEPDGTGIRPMLHGFQYPFGMSWSPDSQWLAFVAQAKGGSRGLWLYNVDEDEAILIARGSFQSPAWSPDGSQLVTVQYDIERDPPRLVRLELEQTELK
jgi:hypothetical protein